MAHGTVQVWKGWDPNSLFRGWFSALGRFKTLIVVGLVLGACLMLTCLIPLVFSKNTIMETITERKMAVWKYKSLNQDDAL
jgi:hypothetical protein